MYSDYPSALQLCEFDRIEGDGIGVCVIGGVNFTVQPVDENRIAIRRHARGKSELRWVKNGVFNFRISDRTEMKCLIEVERFQRR